MRKSVFELKMHSDLGQVQDRVCRILEFCEQTLPAGADASTIVPQVRLALSECIVNVIKHACGQHADYVISIIVRATSNRFIFEIEDHGAEFTDVARATMSRNRAILNTEDLPEGSMGLFLMHAELDSVAYKRLDGRNRWTLVKRFLPEVRISGTRSFIPTTSRYGQSNKRQEMSS